MVQKQKHCMEADAIQMRMDLTFDVPAEFAEQIELWGIYRFEHCGYDEKRKQLCLSASATLFRKGA